MFHIYTEYMVLLKAYIENIYNVIVDTKIYAIFNKPSYND